jgi:hypothetical protein
MTSMTAALPAIAGLPGVRTRRVRHAALDERQQGRSVFIGASPAACPAQANLRPDVLVMNDGNVWGPDPWRPPPV